MLKIDSEISAANLYFLIKSVLKMLLLMVVLVSFFDSYFIYNIKNNIFS